MKRVRHILLVLAMVQGCQCLAEEPSYYRDFLSATSGKRPPFQITSTSLVDTNNCSPSVRRKPISLTVGEIGGVRLGMSMDAVVALWGKPLRIGCCSTGYPSFSFDDVSVRFEENQVYMIGLYAFKPWTPQFAGGLVPISREEEWIRLLGEPTLQHTNASSMSLCYGTNQTVLTLNFDLQDKQLFGVTLRRPSRAELSEKLKGDR